MPVVTPDFELNHMQVGAILYLGMLAQATLPNKRPSHAQEIAAGAAGPLLPESGTRKRTVNGEKRPRANTVSRRNRAPVKEKKRLRPIRIVASG
jgi:hypothetical protein